MEEFLEDFEQIRKLKPGLTVDNHIQLLLAYQANRVADSFEWLREILTAELEND